MLNRELWDKKARRTLVDYLKNHPDIISAIPQFISDGQAFWQGDVQAKFIKTSLATVEEMVNAMSFDDICRQEGSYLFIYVLFEAPINDRGNENFVADIEHTLDHNFVVTFNQHGDIQAITYAKN